MRKFNFRFFVPLAFLVGGFTLNTSIGQSETTAPYAFDATQEMDVQKLLKLQEKFLLKRIRKHPQSGLDQASLAGTYTALASQTGDLSYIDRAEVEAQKSLENLPFYNTTAKLVLAEVAEARHEFPKAIEIAAGILEKSPAHIGALNTMVTAKLGFGQPGEASAYAERLVAVNPDLSSYALRALTKLGQGQNAEAYADFNLALGAEAAGERLQSAWVRFLIARSYARSGDYGAAMAYADSSLSVLPDYHAGLAQKAELVALQDQAAALPLYERAFASREEPPYLLAMANIYESQGNPAEAEKLRLQAENSIRTEINETPYGHYNELAELLIDRRSPEEREEAIAAAKKNIEQRNTSESYFLLAKAFANAGRPEEAKEALNVAITFGETHVEYQKLAQELGQ